jgi:hypothetical protein
MAGRPPALVAAVVVAALVGTARDGGKTPGAPLVVDDPG